MQSKLQKRNVLSCCLNGKKPLQLQNQSAEIRATKLLSCTSAAYQAQIPDNVMIDTYKQMTEVKTKLTLKQHHKPEDVQFYYKNLKFDAFSLNLHEIIMHSAVIVTGSSQTPRDLTTGPIPQSSSIKQAVIKQDYTNATLHDTYGREGPRFGEFNRPHGICVYAVANQVAVVDLLNDRIHLLTDSLRPVSMFGERGEGNNQYQGPCDVTITDRGLMFITDGSNHRIQATDSCDAFLFTFGSEGSGQDQFKYPRGIASTHDHLYICDSHNYRVKMTTHEGTYVRQFGTEGERPGQFCAILNFIAVSEVNNKAVISDYHGNIHIFTLTGQFIRMIEAKQPPLSIDANGLAFDTHGNLIVADYEGKQLVVLGEEDQLLATIGSGQLGNSREVAVTPSGDIIVCDYFKGCVKLFKVPYVTKK